MYIKVISHVIFGTDMYAILMFITILSSVCELNTPFGAFRGQCNPKVSVCGLVGAEMV